MTTAYNHKLLGTVEKPLIPNAEFKTMIEHIESGNTDIKQWLDKYSLESYQKTVAESVIKRVTK